MKPILMALAGFSWFAPHARSAIDYNRMLWVIGEREGGNPSKLGGRYQISYAVWSDHSDLAYQASATPAIADKVARSRLREIVSALGRHGYAVTPGNIYLSWLFGDTGARRQIGTTNGNRLAQYAENLYTDRK